MLNMCMKHNINVKWNDHYSSYFGTKNGVCQGGIISPLLFYLYIDQLIGPRNSGIGCHIGLRYTGCLCYADDLTLLSPTLKGLQKMVNICENFGVTYGVSYNATKTVCIAFSREKIQPDQHIILNGNKLTWCDKVK